MKKLIIASTIALCLSASLTQTAQASSYSADPEVKKSEKTNEAIGFGGGALAGAAIGGPVGALVGGVFGLLIADDVNGDNQLDNKNDELALANKNISIQQRDLLALQASINKMQQEQMIQLASFDDQNNVNWLNDLANFETNLQFKTASFLVEDIYKDQIKHLASILVSYPQLRVKVTGFADKRGDSEYNKALSEQRALAVKSLLVANNVDAKQIIVSGEGETDLGKTSVATSLANVPGNISHGTLEGTSENANTQLNREDLFFARKVNVSLLKPNEQLTAAN
jgi:sortase system peptidoglycan-associated protein